MSEKEYLKKFFKEVIKDGAYDEYIEETLATDFIFHLVKGLKSLELKATLAKEEGRREGVEDMLQLILEMEESWGKHFKIKHLRQALENIANKPNHRPAEEL